MGIIGRLDGFKRDEKKMCAKDFARQFGSDSAKQMHIFGAFAVMNSSYYYYYY